MGASELQFVICKQPTNAASTATRLSKEILNYLLLFVDFSQLSRGEEVRLLDHELIIIISLMSRC